MLKQAIEYLKRQKLVSARELADHLNIDKSSAEGLIQFLIDRNYLRSADAACEGCSKSCGACRVQPLIKSYVWHESSRDQSE